jgi:predicted nucleic acid-binding protein
VIVVDSSVWIDFLNGRNAPHVRQLRAILGIDEVIVSHLMRCEVLQGLESEQAAVSRRLGLSRNWTPPATLCATTTASNSPMSISRMSRADVPPLSCSARRRATVDIKRRVCSAQRRKMAEQSQFRPMHFPHRAKVVHTGDRRDECSRRSHGTLALDCRQ